MAAADAASSAAAAAPAPAPSSSSSSSPTLLVIGATGVTGRAALDGLLAAGVPAGSVLAVTRSESGQGARAVRERGVALAAADLDDGGGGGGAGADGGGSVARVLDAHPSLRAVYVHALSADAASADPRELERARRLAAQLRGRPALRLVLYNSSAGRGSGAGISQMDQKHAAEDLLRAGVDGDEGDGGGGDGDEGGQGGGGGDKAPARRFLALQPAMFYEELWKRYTRPPVLEKGKFPFSVPPDVPVHMVAARDLGTAVAAALREPERYAALGALPLAGDALTPRQMCAAFEKEAREGGAAAAAAAGASSSSSPSVATSVSQSRPPAWLFWLLNRDLYRIVRFLSRPPGYGVDVAAARAAVPGLLTFAEFLRATGWADPSRAYEDGVRYDDVGPVAAAAAAGGKGSPVPVAAPSAGAAGSAAEK